MTRQKHSKMHVHGLPIAVPPELDLPAGAPFEGREQPATMRIPKDIQALLKPLVEMATHAWRLKVRMVDPATGEPREETRKLYRFVEGLFRALGEAGIQVIDKTGKPYDNGMPEKVINFEQTPGLAKEEIIDTVRPSIRWKEQPLYHGEIIVGIPVIEDSPGEAPPPEAVSEPEPPETVIDAGPSAQEAQNARAEDESRPARPQDTPPAHPVGPTTPYHPETSAPAQEREA
jgi:hypothetical protein